MAGYAVALLEWLAALLLGATAMRAGMDMLRAARAERMPDTLSSAAACAVASGAALIVLTLLGVLAISSGVILCALATAITAAVIGLDTDRKPGLAAAGAWKATRRAVPRRRQPGASSGFWQRLLIKRQATPGIGAPLSPLPNGGTPVADHPYDELTPRRGWGPDEPAADRRDPAPMPPPTDGTPSGPAAVADALMSVQVLIAHALAGGMHDLDRTLSAAGEMQGQFAAMMDSLARRLGEPDQHYDSQVWEPLRAMAGHGRAAALAGGAAVSALRAIASMPMGEVSLNPAVQAPHHDRLNAG